MGFTVPMCWSRNWLSILIYLQSVILSTRKVRLTGSTQVARTFQLLSKPVVFPFITLMPGPVSTSHKNEPRELFSKPAWQSSRVWQAGIHVQVYRFPKGNASKCPNGKGRSVALQKCAKKNPPTCRWL